METSIPNTYIMYKYSQTWCGSEYVGLLRLKRIMKKKQINNTQVALIDYAIDTMTSRAKPLIRTQLKIDGAE